MLNQGLKKPKEIFSKERFLAYSPLMRFKYIQKLIKEFVNLNDGVTSSQIVSELGLNYETVVRHLDRIEATGEFYKSTYGKTNVYFGNHKNLHPLGKFDMNFNAKIFSLSILNHNNRDVLFIQEKVIEPSGGYRVKGGVLIPIEDTVKFFSGVKSFLQEYKKMEDNYNENSSKPKRNKGD